MLVRLLGLGLSQALGLLLLGGRSLLLGQLLLVAVGLHLVHLGLEDAHRTAQGTRCVGQAGRSEQQEDDQSDD